MSIKSRGSRGRWRAEYGIFRLFFAGMTGFGFILCALISLWFLLPGTACFFLFLAWLSKKIW